MIIEGRKEISAADTQKPSVYCERNKSYPKLVFSYYGCSHFFIFEDANLQINAKPSAVTVISNI
jgi:hypothetical protein